MLGNKNKESRIRVLPIHPSTTLGQVFWASVLPSSNKSSDHGADDIRELAGENRRWEKVSGFFEDGGMAFFEDESLRCLAPEHRIPPSYVHSSEPRLDRRSHEKYLQGQKSVGPLVSRQEQRAAAVPLINGLSTACQPVVNRSLCSSIRFTYDVVCSCLRRDVHKSCLRCPEKQFMNHHWIGSLSENTQYLLERSGTSFSLT